MLSCGAAVIIFIFHLSFSLFLFFLDTVQYRTAYRVPGYCCGMIATVPGYRSGLSVLQQLTYITVPGYCERTLYCIPAAHSRAVVLSYTSPAMLGRSPLMLCRTQEGGATVDCSGVPAALGYGIFVVVFFSFQFSGLGVKRILLVVVARLQRHRVYTKLFQLFL